MSYPGRVLPIPPPLHYDSSTAPSRPTSNLLEHKIMNDDIAMSDRRMDDAPPYRYSESLPKVDLLSLHRARVGSDSMTPSSPSAPSLDGSKHPSAMPSKAIPGRERSSMSERSSSASPVKTAAPGPRESVTRFCLCQPEPKVPRPRNAFILYRQHYQAQVVANNPGMANPDISKIIGEHWRKLPQEERDVWKGLAEEEKQLHQQKHPDYRYQPRRNGRDGSSRSLSSGLSPSGSTICIKCKGRIMNPPTSPDTPFTGGSISHGRPSQADITATRSYSSDHARPVKHGSHGYSEHRPSRARQWEESGSQSPDTKRRRTNPHVSFRADFRHDRSPPRSPYGLPPYANRSDSMSARAVGYAMQAPRGLHPVKEQPQPDPSLKLPPLQTPTSVAEAATPVTPYPQDGINVETAVMNISFLNKIKLLAKIAPQDQASFREGDSQRRGPVIAVDGQDPTLVKFVTDYLHNALKREGKFDSRIFNGPELPERKREGSTEPGEIDNDSDVFSCMHKWKLVSKEIKSFVKSEPRRHSTESAEPSGTEEDGSPRISPRTIIPRTAEMNINSPPASSETMSEAASSPPETETATPASTVLPSLPVAIIPGYQLTTADAYACAASFRDSYTIPDHWQWMASMWRGTMGPDITVYIRECDAQELKQVGNPVEIRLQGFKTVVVRRPTNSPKELEEKVLKRLCFEIEDYITQ